ncbi:MAG: hypothetical protein V4757_12095 [Pseudomonadota bacterium]
MKLLALSLVALLAACSSKPPVPDWQMNAQSSMERSVAAYLSGNARVDALEFERARSEIARTGRPDLLARAELLRCAGRLASLVVEPCAGFEALRQDAAPPERAYADYLAGKLQAADVALLPETQRAAAAAGAGGDAALVQIKDPLSRLVAAGVLFRTGRASPATMAAAVETASAQGWRRPLLAWLLVQAQRAEQAGAVEEAAKVRRRIEVVEKAGKP